MSKRFSRNNIFSFLCSLLVLLLPVSGVNAESAAKKIKGPITITSDMLTADNKARTALFEKAVVARTMDMTIYADRMLVQYEKDTGNVARIDASGMVKVTTVNRVITSQDAVYYAGEERIVFTGDPRAVEGKNVVTGKKMTYFMNQDRFFVEGSKVFLSDKKE